MRTGVAYRAYGSGHLHGSSGDHPARKIVGEIEKYRDPEAGTENALYKRPMSQGGEGVSSKTQRTRRAHCFNNDEQSRDKRQNAPRERLQIDVGLDFTTEIIS
jgi:hypothetical protein